MLRIYQKKLDSKNNLLYLSQYDIIKNTNVRNVIRQSWIWQTWLFHRLRFSLFRGTKERINPRHGEDAVLLQRRPERRLILQADPILRYFYSRARIVRATVRRNPWKVARLPVWGSEAVIYALHSRQSVHMPNALRIVRRVDIFVPEDLSSSEDI